MNNRHQNIIIQRLSADLLDKAYDWLCKQRHNSSAHNSVWHLRYYWATIKPQLLQQLQAGTYHLSPLRTYIIDGEYVTSWDALDSLVLKAIALVLQPHFTHHTYDTCTHLKHRGGIHGAIKKVRDHQETYAHVLKSDVYHYYESIDHQVLLSSLAKEIGCPHLLNLIKQYCERVEIKEGVYYHQTQGIPKGCPLSPLIAAFYLKPLDDELRDLGCYVRFMDDWILMVKTKQQLRKAIKRTHRVLKKLRLKMHPDKTYFGAEKKGFDFLGVHFGRVPRIAKASVQNHQTRIARRYAQGASEACIGAYRARWTSWCTSVLKCCIVTPDVRSCLPDIDTGSMETGREKTQRSCDDKPGQRTREARTSE